MPLFKTHLEPPYKPRLVKEGLVMVLVPILLSSGLLLYLNWHWQQEGEIAQQQRETFDLAEHGLFMIQSNTFAVNNGSTSHGENDGQLQLEEAHREADLVRGAARRAKLPPKVLELMEKLLAMVARETAELEPLPRDSGEANLNQLMWFKRRFMRYAALADITDKVQQASNSAIEEQWQEACRIRNKLKISLLAGVLATIVAALALIVRFLSRTMSRLRVVMSNSKKIGHFDEKLARIKGNDEIAYLNAELLHADETLRDIEDHRRWVVGMVAHDMRSPLMAAQVSVDIADKAGSETLSAAALLSMEAARSNLEQVGRFVENLLTKERARAEQTETAHRIAAVSAAAGPVAAEYTSPLDMLLKPSLARKVFICVLVPLSLQIGLLAWISDEMQKTERFSVQERQLNRGIAAVNYSLVTFLAAESNLFKYAMYGDPAFHTLAEDYFNKCKATLNNAGMQIAEATGQKYSDLGKNVLFAEIDRLENMKVDPAETIKNPVAFMRRFEIQGEGNLMAFRVRDETVKTVKKWGEQLPVLLEQEQQHRATAQGLIYAGLAINILLTLALIAGLLYGVTSRINILIDHAHRLPKRQPIRDTMGGAPDELSYLDDILQQTCNELIESSEQKRSMMRMVANEMRTPLTLVQKSLRNLNTNEGSALPPAARNQLPAAERSIDSVLALIDDLLTIDKLEAGQIELDPQPANVRLIVNEALTAVANLAEKRKIELINDCADMQVEVDKARINQVLINLIANAIKFSDKGKQITVVCNRSPGTVRIGVRDQGPGMKRETASRVFDTYYQAEGSKKKEGFGLGLAICKLIVETHGGSMSVDSQLGKGSTFWINLPA